MSRILTETNHYIIITGGEYGTEYALFRKSDMHKLATISEEKPEYIKQLIELLKTDTPAAIKETF